MKRFTRQEELEADATAEKEWLVGELARLCAEKGLAADLSWEIEVGRREIETMEGRHLVQMGIRVRRSGLDADETLACFLPLGDLTEDGNETTSLVLSLWLDRVS
jgi:hypothetical protein